MKRNNYSTRKLVREYNGGDDYNDWPFDKASNDRRNNYDPTVEDNTVEIPIEEFASPGYSEFQAEQTDETPIKAVWYLRDVIDNHRYMDEDYIDEISKVYDMNAIMALAFMFDDNVIVHMSSNHYDEPEYTIDKEQLNTTVKNINGSLYFLHKYRDYAPPRNTEELNEILISYGRDVIENYFNSTETGQFYNSGDDPDAIENYADPESLYNESRNRNNINKANITIQDINEMVMSTVMKVLKEGKGCCEMSDPNQYRGDYYMDANQDEIRSYQKHMAKKNRTQKKGPRKMRPER